MTGLRTLNVILTLDSMAQCKNHSSFHGDGEMNVDHGQAEPFVLQPLTAVKQALASELDLNLMIDWVVLGHHSALEEAAVESGIVVMRTKIPPWEMIKERNLD